MNQSTPPGRFVEVFMGYWLDVRRHPAPLFSFRVAFYKFSSPSPIPVIHILIRSTLLKSFSFSGTLITHTPFSHGFCQSYFTEFLYAGKEIFISSPFSLPTLIIHLR